MNRFFGQSINRRVITRINRRINTRVKSRKMRSHANGMIGAMTYSQQYRQQGQWASDRLYGYHAYARRHHIHGYPRHRKLARKRDEHPNGPFKRHCNRHGKCLPDQYRCVWKKLSDMQASIHRKCPQCRRSFKTWTAQWPR